MATLEAGDWQIATLSVSVHDGTTSATLTVVPPSGVTSTPAVTASDGGATWTAAGYEFTDPGEWIERWVVTGTGKGTERRILLVAPDPLAVPSGTRVYASTTDYANALRKAPPANSRRALADASRAVDAMLLTAVYDVDVAGMPTDAAVIVAVRDATCAQAEDLRAAKAAAAGSFSIGAISVTRSAPVTVRDEDYRSPRAYEILQQAGLTGQSPWSY